MKLQWGPALIAGKGASAGLRSGVDAALQWGPALIAGKGCEPTTTGFSSRVSTLQWGPALIAGKGRRPDRRPVRLAAASMGPGSHRRERRPDLAHFWATVQRLQWGPALIAGKGSGIARRGRSPRGRFNGARLSSPGKATSEHVVTLEGVLLQWGPALIAGKGEAWVQVVKAPGKLQWGPALIAGKGRAAAAIIRSWAAASMGPGSHRRERQHESGGANQVD